MTLSFNCTKIRVVKLIYITRSEYRGIGNGTNTGKDEGMHCAATRAGYRLVCYIDANARGT